MSPETHSILVLAAFFAVELFVIDVVFPEWKRRRQTRRQQKQNNPDHK